MTDSGIGREKEAGEVLNVNQQFLSHTFQLRDWQKVETVSLPEATCDKDCPGLRLSVRLQSLLVVQWTDKLSAQGFF